MTTKTINPEQLEVFNSSLAVISMYLSGLPDSDVQRVRGALVAMLETIDNRILTEGGKGGSY